jgi:hypothetical protein
MLIETTSMAVSGAPWSESRYSIASAKALVDSSTTDVAMRIGTTWACGAPPRKLPLGVGSRICCSCPPARIAMVAVP